MLKISYLQKRDYEKKTPLNAGSLNDYCFYLQLCDILGCRTLRTCNNLKLYPGALLEGLKAFGLYCGVVHENVLAAILLDKTKTLSIIKPFYCSFYHFKLLLTVSASPGTA